MTDYTLKEGPHNTREDGMCAMEWVAFLADEPHSDSPVCVCPVLRNFVIGVNDALPAEDRPKLRPYLARTIGTADDGQEEQRGELLLREDPCPPSRFAIFDPLYIGSRIAATNPEKAFDLLEQMLPTEHIDLPEPARQELDRLLSA